MTHVLLLSSLLLRRRDEAQVIGAAPLAHACGHGHWPVAAYLDPPEATVRGWLRRFDLSTELLRVTATIWLHHLDPNADASDPGRSEASEALEAPVRAARAGRLRIGVETGGVRDDINSLVG